MPTASQRNRPYFLILIIVLLVVLLSFPPLNSIFGGRPLFQVMVFPFQYAVSRVFSWTTGSLSNILSLSGAQRENQRLMSENAALKAQVQELMLLQEENLRLRQALNYVNPRQYALLAAQVIGRDYGLITIDRGFDSGLKKNLAVISEQGLVGKVVEVSKFSSKVLLLIDARSSVAVVDRRSRDFGVVEGRGYGMLDMCFVASEADVAVGDAVITSSVSDFFPPGLLIGLVSATSKKEHDLFKQISVKPAVDFSKLEQVFVLKK